jgi:hypothetical protein
LGDIVAVLWVSGSVVYVLIMFSITSYYHFSFEELFDYIECSAVRVKVKNRQRGYSSIGLSEPFRKALLWSKFMSSVMVFKSR